MVPAVTEVWYPQPPHCSNTTRTGQDFPPPQRGHRKPSGHRSRKRYSRHASSVANRASNSVKFRGYSSIPPHYIFGLPESSTYPSTTKGIRIGFSLSGQVLHYSGAGHLITIAPTRMGTRSRRVIVWG